MQIYIYIYIYIYICIYTHIFIKANFIKIDRTQFLIFNCNLSVSLPLCIYECVCVCVREREREKEREIDKDRDREREREEEKHRKNMTWINKDCKCDNIYPSQSPRIAKVITQPFLFVLKRISTRHLFARNCTS